MKVLVVDPLKCAGGKNCELACSFAKTGRFNIADSRVKIHFFQESIKFVPTVCMQCRDAYCLQVCPTGSLNRDASNGVINLNQDTCIGCKQCIVACPWGSVKLDVAGERIMKCDLCGGDPACVKVCESGALRFVEADEAVSSKQRETAERYMDIAQAIQRGGETHA
ncbi:MAG: 4Fe-4S dicluster domain-containing protein [Deltaproteobacteria bacterium]|nr:4Fe-4S dicluster domain-containing protein [Deltaproteobacteria bacterium]